MKLTNQQVQDAHQALMQWSPKEINFKTKMRLSRNLRKLSAAVTDKEHDRLQLLFSVITDKTRRPNQNEQIHLTAEEQVIFQPLVEKLMKEVVEVDIHTVPLVERCDDTDIAINVKLVDIPPFVTSALVDVIFVEP